MQQRFSSTRSKLKAMMDCEMDGPFGDLLFKHVSWQIKWKSENVCACLSCLLRRLKNAKRGAHYLFP